MSALALGAGSVWVADPVGGSVWRVVPGSGAGAAADPARARGARRSRTVTARSGQRTRSPTRCTESLPARTRREVVSRTIAPQRVAVAADAVWVTALGPPSDGRDAAGLRLRRVSPRGGDRPPLPDRLGPAAAGPVPGRTCRRWWTPSATSSSGAASGPAATAWATAPATTRPLRPAAPTSSAASRTRRRYARTPDVLGVIGSFFSFCSEPPDPDRQPGGRRPARHDQPLEHGHRAHAAVAGHAARRARGALPHRRSETTPASRPRTTSRPWRSPRPPSSSALRAWSCSGTARTRTRPPTPPTCGAAARELGLEVAEAAAPGTRPRVASPRSPGGSRTPARRRC